MALARFGFNSLGINAEDFQAPDQQEIKQLKEIQIFS